MNLRPFLDAIDTGIKQPVHGALPQAAVPAAKPVSAPVQAADTIQSTKPVQTDGGSKKLRTAPPPAAFATANDGWQFTGPLAEKLPQPRVATVNVWAVPGATIHIYNPMVLEDGKPKLIATAVAPEKSNGPSNVGAYATSNDFAKLSQTFGAKGTAGMVAVAVSLPKDADWHVNDVIQVSQKVGDRLESLPVTMDFLAYRSGLPANTHAPYVEQGRIDISKTAITATDAYAVPPRARLQLLRDGLPEGNAVQADDEGKFSIALPAQPGPWELQVGNAGGVTKIAIAGKVEPWSDRIARWERGLREGLLQAPGADNTLCLTLEGLPKDYAVSITNPSNGPEPQVFVADAKGRLEIAVKDVTSGDTLAVDAEAIKVADSKGGVRHWELDAVYQVPTAEEAARFALVGGALAGRSEREIKHAFELMGPFSPFEALREICEPAQIAAVLDGAKLGGAVARMGWAAKVSPHVATHSDPCFVLGYQHGLKYKGDYRASSAEIGLERTHVGAKRMVITGGYSPISGSHGPLRPETVKDADTYQLSIKGLSPLTLSAGGYGPTGWVNPNAILLTYTRSGTSSSWQEG